MAPSGDKLSQVSDFYVRRWFVAWVGDQLLHLVAHREVQVQAFWWDRALEPLAVDLVDLAGLVQGDDGVIDSFLEGWVVFTHHARVGFEGLRSTGDDPVVRLLGLGFFTGQQGVVHHESYGAAAFQHLEGFAVVFGRDDVHAHLLVGVHRLDDALGRGASGGHDVLAFQVSEVGVARLAILVFLDQQAGNKDPVAGNRLGLLSKKDSPYKDFADLKGKNVVTTAGTTSERILKAMNADKQMGMNVISAKDHGEAFNMLESGRAVAFMMDDALLAGEMAKAKKPTDWAVTGTPQSYEIYGCMLRKGDPDFKKAVDDAIVAYYKSGKINDTYKTWFESPIPPKGLNLMFPMSDELKALIANPTDKAADDKPAEEKKS